MTNSIFLIIWLIFIGLWFLGFVGYALYCRIRHSRMQKGPYKTLALVVEVKKKRRFFALTKNSYEIQMSYEVKGRYYGGKGRVDTDRENSIEAGDEIWVICEKSHPTNQCLADHPMASKLSNYFFASLLPFLLFVISWRAR